MMRYVLTQGEHVMKLHLLFVLIDLLTILTYPFVFVWSKLRQIFNLTKNAN